MRERPVWPATIDLGFGRCKGYRWSVKKTSRMTVISYYTEPSKNCGKRCSSAITYSRLYATRTKRAAVGGAMVDLMATKLSFYTMPTDANIIIMKQRT